MADMVQTMHAPGVTRSGDGRIPNQSKGTSLLTEALKDLKKAQQKERELGEAYNIAEGDNRQARNKLLRELNMNGYEVVGFGNDYVYPKQYKTKGIIRKKQVRRRGVRHEDEQIKPDKALTNQLHELGFDKDVREKRFAWEAAKKSVQQAKEVIAIIQGENPFYGERHHANARRYY